MSTADNIAIVVPVYNTKPKYLCECFSSILRQSVKPKQILIIDDSSTNTDTICYLSSFADFASNNIRLIHNERNRGLGVTMNYGLESCETDFVLKIDSDDIPHQKLVESYATFIETNSNVDVLGCQCQNFGMTDFVTNHPIKVTRDYAIKHTWFVNHTGILLNRKSVINAGGYRSLRGMAEDYELWIRMMLYGFNNFYNLPDVLMYYRDEQTGLHRHMSGWINRPLRILLPKLLRFCPNF
jgi:glycosyltransferase involved in cell wall biosynthesis